MRKTFSDCDLPLFFLLLPRRQRLNGIPNRHFSFSTKTVLAYSYKQTALFLSLLSTIVVCSCVHIEPVPEYYGDETEEGDLEITTDSDSHAGTDTQTSTASSPIDCMESPCGANATCDDSGGTRVCACDSGYEPAGDGINCQDIDECRTIPNTCDPLSEGICVNEPGSHRCSCSLQAKGSAGDICLDGFVAEQVSVGDDHVCALGRDGAIACWGADASPPPSGAFRQIAAGNKHTCGLRTNDGVVCWPQESYDISPPVDTLFKQISSGFLYSCGIRKDNTLACWGPQSPDWPTEEFLHIDAGDVYACGVTLNGALTCWNSVAQPPGGESFVKVAVGYGDFCAITENGAVTCWGETEDTVLEPEEDTVFNQIDLGQYYGCGVTRTGEISCFGDSPADPPPGSFVQVSAGNKKACGVTTEGKIDCW